MKRLPLLLALGLVVIVVAAAFVLLDGDDAGPQGSGIAAAVVVDDQDRGADRVPDLTPVEGTRASLAAAPAAPVVEAPVGDRPMPMSYRAALGGVFGRLVEEDGTPVVDTDVELVGGGMWDMFKPLDVLTRGGSAELEISLGTATSDAEGRFRFAALEPRMLGALIIDPGGPRSLLHPLEETPVSGAERDLGDIVVPAGVTLIGRVVDERSQPLEGVRVRATDVQPIVLSSGVADYRPGGAVLVDADEGGRELNMVIDVPTSIERVERLLPFPTTYTDEEGRYVLAGVRTGQISLVADDGRHLTAIEGPFPTGDTGNEREVDDIILRDGLTVSGRVVDQKGKPVPYAQVMVGNQLLVGPVALLRPPVLADEGGRFTVGGLRDGTVRAAARAKPHHVLTPDPGGASAGTELVVTLPGRRSLTLTLVDQDDVPLEGARFFARRLPIEDLEQLPDFLMLPTARASEHGLSRDDDGRWVLDDMDPGRWDVLIAVEGHGRLRRTFDLTLEDLTERIVLERAQDLVVRVVRAEGLEPVDFARIMVRPSDGDRDMPRAVASARSDADGGAVLADLDDGDYVLEVEHPALAVTTLPVTLPRPDDETELVIALREGGVIRGTVLENGAPPVEPLMVTLTREDDLQSNGVIPRMTLTDLEGRFTFAKVDPGKVGLEARSRLSFTSLTTWWEPFVMTAQAEGSVYVESGQEAEVTLVVGSSWADVATGFVEGHLTVNNRPAAGWKVRTFGKIRRSATVGGDGRYTLGDLAAGETSLLFNAPGQAMTEGAVGSTDFVLTEGERRFVQTDLSTGSVEGRVWSGADGQAVAGAQVTLEVQGPKAGNRGWWGRRSGTALTDADGRYSLSPVSEGSYIVAVESEGYAKARSDVIGVSALRPTRGVDVRLMSAVRLSGRLVFEDLDEQPSWAWLNATTESGDQAGARVDTGTWTYSFDDLAPERTWKISVYTNLDIEMTVAERYVRSDESDVTLSFRPAPEVEEEPADLFFDAIETTSDGK